MAVEWSKQTFTDLINFLTLCNKSSLQSLSKKVFIFTGMSRFFVIIIFLMFVLLMAACDRDRLYDESLSVPGEGWHKDSALVYRVNVEDSVALHRFYLNIRHNTDYSFSNIFVFLDTRFPNGNETRDTLECMLADKQGRWYGTGAGRIRDNQILIREGLRFPRCGEYIFRITQGMRRTTLDGMEDIGIRIEEMNH